MSKENTPSEQVDPPLSEIRAKFSEDEFIELLREANMEAEQNQLQFLTDNDLDLEPEKYAQYHRDIRFDNFVITS